MTTSWNTVPCDECGEHAQNHACDRCMEYHEEAVTKLREDRAALLAACKKIVNNWGNLHPKDLQQCKFAIARAEGD